MAPGRRYGISTDSVLSVILFAVGVSLGPVVSPGPVTAAVATEAPRRGWAVGPWVTGGHALLELLMVLGISVGLSTGLGAAAARPLAILGGVVLLGIGLSYLTAAYRGTMMLPSSEGKGSARARSSLFGLGLATTLSNPFWYTWWITVATGYLGQVHALGGGAVMAFYLGHIATDFGWNTLLASMFSAGRRWLSAGRYRVLILLMGAFMIYFGVTFLAAGLKP